MTEKNLVPLDKYLKTGAHIGTKFKTGDMRRYIFKRRKDGLNVLDVENVDERILIAASFISNFELGKVAAVSRRAYGQRAVQQFAKALGAKALVGRFVPGTFSNPRAREFIEPSVVVVTDPEVDSQAVSEASKIKVPVVGLCSTNNYLTNIDLIIPINNKGRKSLALAYWLLAREILKNKGIIKKDADFSYKASDFEYELKEEAAEGEEMAGEEEEIKKALHKKIDR